MGRLGRNSDAVVSQTVTGPVVMARTGSGTALSRKEAFRGMNVLEALQARNPEYLIRVEEEFDAYKKHYRYFLRVGTRRTVIFYTASELTAHTVHRNTGALMYTAIRNHVERNLGLKLR